MSNYSKRKIFMHKFCQIQEWSTLYFKRTWEWAVGKKEKLPFQRLFFLPFFYIEDVISPEKEHSIESFPSKLSYLISLKQEYLEVLSYGFRKVLRQECTPSQGFNSILFQFYQNGFKLTFFILQTVGQFNAWPGKQTGIV